MRRARRALAWTTAFAAAALVSWALRRGKRGPEPRSLAVPPATSSAAAAPATSSAAPRAPARSLEGATGAVRAGLPSMQGLDPHRTNRSPFVAPRAPAIAWKVELGGPIAVAPAMTADLVIAATLLGKIVGVRAGAIAWSHDAHDRVYGSPLVLGDLAWVGVDGGAMLSLRTTDGAERSRVVTKGDADGAAAPLADGGLVFVAGRRVTALDARGRERWSYEAKRKLFTAPAVSDDGGVVVAGQDDHVTMLALKDGAVRWRTHVGADADGGPSIADDGTIVVGTDGGEVVALEPSAGAIRWRRDVGGFVRGGLAIGRDGTIFAGVFGPSPGVVALDPRGAIVFRVGINGTGAKEHGVRGAPVEDAEGTLVFGGQDDRVYALDANGSERWVVDLDGDVDGTLALGERILVVGTYAGTLVALADRE